MVGSVISLFALLALLGLESVHGLTHYPPANTSNTVLEQVLNGNDIPGIYSSSETPDSEYGQYNWCAMPHIRKTEYKVPSKDYELKYVEVIQRHHKRTPYASNTFFKEDIPWDCSKEGPYADAKVDNDLHPTRVYWQSLHNTQNPFEYTVGPGFVNSTCQFPGITSEGVEDAYVHGKDLYGVYGDLLKFLPLPEEKEKYRFRVSNNVITSQTLSGFARGLYPGIKEYPAYVQPSNIDSLAPGLTCNLKDAIASQITSLSSPWGNHLNQSLALRERFNNVSGIEENDTAGWATSWDHPYDNLSAKQCHNKPLPCSVNNTAVCVTQDDANAIYRLGNYEYAYRWRMAENSTLYSALTMGPWFLELQDHMRGIMEGSNHVKYLHNFAHDGSIAPVLGLLQIDQPVWPGMGSEVVFELWQKSSSYFVRVMWNGQPLKTSTPLGVLDMIEWEEFEAYLNDTIPEDLVGLCNSVKKSL
nr:uncharacterized protein CI109_005877 [Kwoniella shandongensis]KAA5525853.1 hypothetical protein CI109_005877 [Kwoniella shandongensis]